MDKKEIKQKIEIFLKEEAKKEFSLNQTVNLYKDTISFSSARDFNDFLSKTFPSLHLEENEEDFCDGSHTENKIIFKGVLIIEINPYSYRHYRNEEDLINYIENIFKFKDEAINKLK